MRKRISILVVLLVIGFIVGGKLLARNNQSDNFLLNISPTPTADKSQLDISKESLSVFVPYWAIGTSVLSEKYDRYYYFGIAGNKTGIDTTDPGYKNIQQFIQKVPVGKEKYIVVRMVDSSVNSAVLRDTAAQLTIIQDTIQVANKYGFDGIVLDFEINALAFESVTKEINSFIGLFGASVEKSNIPFFITIYGDTFYRLRPYDLKSLAKNTDGIMIMTYDLHKARGNPGPNFPLSGKAKYGYDLEKLVEDFSEVVPTNKTTIILGLFGYDWVVDDKNNSVGNGVALSLNQINQKFIQGCAFKNCKVERDQSSSETKITYTDSDGKNHIVWFEDMESLNKKKKFLESKGINSISLWAYSYF